MRVLLVQLSVGFNGTERHTVELANALVGHVDVAILLRREPFAPHRKPAWRAMRAALAPGVRVFLAGRASPVLGLWHALIRFRPDLVHAHHDRSARITGRFAPVPIIATIHMRYTARDFGRSTALVALTEQARALTLAAGFRREVALIANWVLPWPRPDATQIAAVRAEFGIGANDFVFGSIGRLEPVKRMAGLIAAFAEAALPGAHLLIVGDGEQRGALEAQIAALGLQGRAHLAGFRADARNFYAAFDRFVLNSEHDPYPLVLLEAAEQQVSIIATATQGGSAIARAHPMILVSIDRPGELVDALRVARAEGGGSGDAALVPRLAGHDLADRLPELLALYRRVAKLDERT